MEVKSSDVSYNEQMPNAQDFKTLLCNKTLNSASASVVVKDLQLKDEDKDEDLKISPRGYRRGQGLSSRTTTL